MAATILKISKRAPNRDGSSRALREAGLGVIEVEDWDQAAEALRGCEAALVVCDGEVLDAVDAGVLRKALSVLGGGRKASSPVLAPDIARALSHELRTPLSAMAGWVHLMESGTLDAAAQKRAIGKLRENIAEQVRTIERFLGKAPSGADQQEERL